jgi:hypothetical protein
VKTFEAAREVFKLAMARHAAAKQFYVLDGYVTDYVSLCRNVSALYKWLAVFEADEKRRTAMLGRRVAELAPILDQLGANAYNDTLKQLAFEVGVGVVVVVGSGGGGGEGGRGYNKDGILRTFPLPPRAYHKRNPFSHAP